MSSANALVSIVLPTYNDSAHLDKAVRSVLRQTYPTWELVVVDDASTDTTPKAIATYDDPRIRYVRVDVNRGVAAAQSTGVEHASGDFVVFLHSDDELFPDMIERHVALMEASSDVIDGVQSAVEVRWPHRTEVWPPTLEGMQPHDVLWVRTRVHICGLMVRREVAKEIGFDPRLRGAEDRDFCFRLLHRAKLVFTPETLSRVWKRPGGLSSQNMAPHYVLLLDKHREEIESDPELDGEWNFRIARAHARANEFGEARRALRRSVWLYPRKPARWALLVASLGGNTATRVAFSAYVRVSRGRQSP